ncbi:hypothetical protein CPB85DRAFT_1334538, partial [Mucidula mucida]
MIPAMGTLLPLIEVWISYMTALFFAGPGEVVGLEDFIAIIEVLLAEVMRLVSINLTTLIGSLRRSYTGRLHLQSKPHAPLDTSRIPPSRT